MSRKEGKFIRASNMSKDTQIELVKFVAVLRSLSAEKNEMPSRGDFFETIGYRFGRVLGYQHFSVKNKAGVFITFSSSKARNDFTAFLRRVPRGHSLYHLREMNRTMELVVLEDFYMVPNALIAIMKASGTKLDADGSDTNEPGSPNQPPYRTLGPRSRSPLMNRIMFTSTNDNRTRRAGGAKLPSPPSAKRRPVPTGPKATRRFTAPIDTPQAKMPQSPSLLDRISPPWGSPGSARATKGTMTNVQSQAIEPSMSLNAAKDTFETRGASGQPTAPDSTSTPHTPISSPTETNLPRLPDSSERDDVIRRDTHEESSVNANTASIRSENNGQEPSDASLEYEIRLRETEDKLRSIETLLTETQAKLVASEEKMEAERSSKMDAQAQLVQVRVELKALKLDLARMPGLDRQPQMTEASVQMDEEMANGDAVTIEERRPTSSMFAERINTLPHEVVEPIRVKAEGGDEFGREGSVVLQHDTPDKQKEMEGIESTQVPQLRAELERQKNLYEGMLQFARLDRGQHEIELKRQQASYEARLRELRDEVLAQNVNALAAKFPDASRSLVHAFVLTANLGKRKRKD